MAKSKPKITTPEIERAMAAQSQRIEVTTSVFWGGFRITIRCAKDVLETESEESGDARATEIESRLAYTLDRLHAQYPDLVFEVWPVGEH